MDDRREEARRWVWRKRRFYTILAVYLALSLLWFAIDMLTGTDDLWFYWPVLGAGVIVGDRHRHVRYRRALPCRLGTAAGRQVPGTPGPWGERRKRPGRPSTSRLRATVGDGLLRSEAGPALDPGGAQG
jgi:2TM domain